MSSLFASIDKIPRVTSPVLVIHGTEDEVIDFSHGLAIYEVRKKDQPSSLVFILTKCFVSEMSAGCGASLG